jgi:3-hydroxyacyl-CoA dehydrogenase
MADLIHYDKHAGVGVIALDNPPLNALAQTKGLLQGIYEAIAHGRADPEVRAFVLIGRNRSFSSGADISEFGKPRAADKADLRQLTTYMDECDKPLIAAIHGPTMGGGLELALACHYRIAAPDASFALPEVKLGLLPGAGGTQRLPRVIGVAAALDMITTGDVIGAAKAQELGLIERVVNGDLLQAGLGFANEIVAAKQAPRRTRDLIAQVKGDPASYFAAARDRVGKASRGFPAPLVCLQCVENAVTLPFDDGYAREHDLFTQLMGGNESRALRHAFFAERACNKIPDVPDTTPVRPIKQGAVIGCGTMGGGISMNFANAGIPVMVIEANQAALDRGMATIKKNYAATVAKGRLSQAEMDRRMSLISPSLRFDDVASADVVIEAVFEEMEVKQATFRKLDAVAKEGAILATNTSTLNIDRIADVTRRPESVIGTHFFSPANVMRLLELVRGEHTAKDVIATSMKLAKQMGKVGVLARVCDGFIGNRMIEEYIRQATLLLEEGALPHEVDGALQEWGMAMGPFAMSDLAGLDIGWAIRKRKRRENPNEVFSAVGDKICELGRFGQKTGSGYFRYEAGNRKPQRDPVVEELILAHAQERGITRRAISAEEIIERCIYALVNVGAQLLDEGIALRASDIDIVYLTGYGFPRYRGGPMFYADTIGVQQVYQRVCEFERQLGHLWKPAPLLKSIAAAGSRFNT